MKGCWVDPGNSRRTTAPTERVRAVKTLANAGRAGEGGEERGGGEEGTAGMVGGWEVRSRLRGDEARGFFLTRQCDVGRSYAVPQAPQLPTMLKFVTAFSLALTLLSGASAYTPTSPVGRRVAIQRTFLGAAAATVGVAPASALRDVSSVPTEPVLERAATSKVRWERRV